MTTLTLDLNQPCTRCKSPGRVLEDPAGRCRRCVEADAVPDAGPRPEPAPLRPNPLLTARLQALISDVERAADRRFHFFDLRHGLRVEVGLGSQFNLRLSRAGCAPSAQEWATVLAFLPAAYQPACDVAPREFEQVGRIYLDAHWPLAEQ